MEKNRVEVVIDGQIITLVSEEKEEHMQKLALYIDKKLNEIKSSKSSKPVSEHLRTLLISVNIADDYFKAMGKHQALEETHEAYVNEMGSMREENVLLTEKLHELQAQLGFVREQYVQEVGQLQDENARLTEQVQELTSQLTNQTQSTTQELEELQKKSARLSELNRNLQEQLQYAREELDEYISTFDEQQDTLPNVVNFNSGVGR
jgi:cell division protein ZapA